MSTSSFEDSEDSQDFGSDLDSFINDDSDVDDAEVSSLSLTNDEDGSAGIKAENILNTTRTRKRPVTYYDTNRASLKKTILEDKDYEPGSDSDSDSDSDSYSSDDSEEEYTADDGECSSESAVSDFSLN